MRGNDVRRYKYNLVHKTNQSFGRVALEVQKAIVLKYETDPFFYNQETNDTMNCGTSLQIVKGSACTEIQEKTLERQTNYARDY